MLSRLRLILALALVLVLVALPATAALPLEAPDHDDHEHSHDDHADEHDGHDVLGEFDDPHGHSHDDVSEADLAHAAATIAENAERWSGFLDELRLNSSNPIATDEATYQAYARVFSDPHGCLVHDGFEPPEGAPVSPYAKGRGCQLDYLTYEEVIEGAKFLERRFPDLLQVIRLDEAYDDASMTSAGIARPVAFENGTFKLFGRDTSPLYMFKVTNANSEIPEADRLHFTYGLSIHGLERAGLEGGVRAMEDLVTWAACEDDERAGDIPACELEGPFPKEIVESDTERPVPTAGEVLDHTVNYFFLPNPDGWRLGQKRSATELRGGDANVNYLPGPSYLRGNGHGVDLNRDWPSIGYTDKGHQPLSEPETRAFHDVFSDIRDRTSAGHFAGGIDLHGMLLASAFSYTLLGADQRDFRKNDITVETSLRTYEDQTQRLRWSPYIGDSTGDGEQDQPAALIPVADEWGTIYDTIGYTVTGALGFWMDDSRIGLGGVGINNEMALSNLAPNSVYEPGLNQTHIDGNKGLIYSQIAALMFEEEVAFEPTGTVGYVHNPIRIVDEGFDRPANPGLHAQNDIDVFLPCQGELQQQLPSNCGPGTFSMEGADVTYEFEVLGNDRGVHNGGMTVRSTTPQQGVGAVHLTAGVILERLGDEGEWETMKTLSRTNTTYNDPEPGTWRIRFDTLPDAFPRRVEISFQRDTAEADPGQNPIDASTMDFFTELNEYVPAGKELRAVEIESVVTGDLDAYDTLVVTNDLGNASWLADEQDGLGLSGAEVEQYFAALRGFAESGGNLVLTDGALHGLADLGLVDAEAIVEGGGLAGFYAFAPDGELTYADPDTYPLTRGVDLPGAAERNLGERQAVEPTPLGFHPGGAGHAQMPFWGVDRGAWEANCQAEEPTHCTAATTSSQGSATNLGEVTVGEGVIRIAGTLLPDPLRQEDHRGDNRFGLASYALTYTSYIVFENLIDWDRGRDDTDPQEPDEPVATQLTYTGETTVRGNDDVRLAAELATADGTPIAGATVTFAYDGEEYPAVTNEDGRADVDAPAHSGREATVTVTFAGDDDHEPSSTEATVRRGQGNGQGSAAAASSGGFAAQAAASLGTPFAGTVLWLTVGLFAAALATFLVRRRSLGGH
jgi:hypothetical protein